MDKPVALNLYSIRNLIQTEEGLEDAVKKVKEMGYDGVQVSGIRDLEPEAIWRIIDRHELEIAVTHIAWNLFKDELDRVIEIHQLYRCSHAAVGSLPAEYNSPEGAQRFCSEVVPVAEGLASQGLDFSYHNHSHELAKYEGKTWLQTVMEAVPGSLLKFEIDTYWIQAGGGDPAEWIKKCAGRIPVLHLKDMIVTPDREQRFAPVGSGNLEWDRIMQAAAQSGVQWYVVEQDEFYESDPFEDVAASCRWLKAY
jgi:sugar phosphate isomerase/epimerase